MGEQRIYIEDSAALENLAISGLITKGRCRLGLVLLTAGSANATATVYDGIDDLGKYLFDLDALTAYSKVVDFRFTVKIESGIYIKLSGAGAFVTVTYLPIF